MLMPLKRDHGLMEVTLLSPQDAPHNRSGFAIEKSLGKRAAIARQLEKYLEAISSAFKANRVLVAGGFAQHVLKLAFEKHKAKLTVQQMINNASIAYPCWWSQFKKYPVKHTAAKLASVLGAGAPSSTRLKTIIVYAHNQSLRDREARLTPEEKAQRSEEARLRWERLPQEEKDKVSEEARLRWERLPQEEKDKVSEEARLRWERLPQEEKERRGLQSSVEMMQVWARMSFQEKLRRKNALLAPRLSAEGKRRFRLSLVNAWLRSDPVLRQRRITQLRAGYKLKMTTERQAEIGQKRRLAWDEDRRQAARERGLQPANLEIAKANLDKAHQALKESGRMEVRNDKKRQTELQKHLEVLKALVARNPSDWSKEQRRTLRDRSRKWLKDAEQQKVQMSDATKELLEQAIAKSVEFGAEAKSQGLQDRHAVFRGSNEQAALQAPTLQKKLDAGPSSWSKDEKGFVTKRVKQWLPLVAKGEVVLEPEVLAVFERAKAALDRLNGITSDVVSAASNSSAASAPAAPAMMRGADRAKAKAAPQQCPSSPSYS